ncbi:MAG: ChbG/HpnK family deacetylase [Anaerolineaceae bacterium]
MNKKLIVNADDYGHTRGVSQGIRQAHLRGIVTSTTAMMNYPGADDDLREAVRECPRLGLGLHLVLTSGNPVLPVEKVPDLVDGEGKFYKYDPFVERMHQINLTQVNLEWHAQVEAFKNAIGRLPDHLDSHHHSSYFTPALFELMLDLSDELEVPIRLPFGMQNTALSEISSPDVGSKIANRPQGYAQFFIDGFYVDGVTLDNLKSILQQIAGDDEHDTFELMTHPAVVDDELIRTSIYNERRADELKLLYHGLTFSALKSCGIELINYSDLNS